ncbi:hypothetical protein MP638_007176 [Amoeboaphelidium occidentale]|nr:hypothetical protein MP638_007176 [Amoeboaphelidium occidentale]
MREFHDHHFDYAVILKCNSDEEEITEVAFLLHGLRSKGLDYELVQLKDKGKLAVLVRCTQERLHREHIKETVSDVVNGIGSVDINDLQSMLTKGQQRNAPFAVSSSHRLRLVYNVLTGPTGEIGGLNLFENPLWKPRIETIFALQHRKYNKDFLKKLRSTYFLSIGDLTEIRDHFGHSIALYFDFLQFYLIALMVPSILSLPIYWFGLQFSPWFTGLVCLWGLIFVEFWAVREQRLSLLWGCQNCSKEDEVRGGYVPDVMERDMITGEMIMDNIFWKDWIRSGITVLIIALLSLTLAFLVFVIFCIQMVIDSAYVGPFKEYITFAPTIAYAGLIPQFTGFYYATAKRLTEFEKPKYQRSFAHSLNQKIFLANAIINFSAPLMYGLVFVPFGSFITSYLEGFLPIKEAHLDVKMFEGQVVYFILTGQLINFFMETALPVILRDVPKLFNRKGSESTKDTDLVDSSHVEKMTIAKQVEEEAALPDYNVNDDYSEMVIQFGYVTLFSCVYPLAALFSLINNWIEVRSDAFKICFNTRRPIPTREETIGPWLQNMKLLVWTSFAANSVWIYFYRNPDPDFKDPWLWVSVLAAIIFWEHIYFASDHIVKLLIESFPSAARAQARNVEYKRRKDVIQTISSPVALSSTISSADFNVSNAEIDTLKEEIKAKFKSE